MIKLTVLARLVGPEKVSASTSASYEPFRKLSQRAAHLSLRHFDFMHLQEVIYYLR